jgi:SAM-dependent methyltransferase
LEHLTLDEFRVALRHTFRLLKPGGVFRFVVPDIEESARLYVDAQDAEAAIRFIRRSGLGRVSRPRGLVSMVKELFGHEHHLWMWDFKSLRNELETVGFSGIRRCQFGDAKNSAFTLVEDSSRFEGALEIECSRPIA